MSEGQFRFTPAVLFKSFALVAGAYVANWVLMFIAASVMFPESMSIITGEPAEFQRILETEPERVYPEEMSWALLLASAGICFGLGGAVARLAPISSFSHAILFAMILFVQYLQLAIGAESTWRNNLILFMAISPVAALLGANFFAPKRSQTVSHD